MSVIIVALPGAPKVCAVQQEIDNKLNLDIESCIKGIILSNNLYPINIFIINIFVQII